MNKKFICPICGYVHEGAPAPERCPQCKQVVTWKEVDESAGIAFACEHIIGVAKDTDEEMIKNKDVIMRFRKEIDKYNAELGDYEQVKKFELIAKEWTIESGEMTASLKPRRSKIMQNYADLVEKIYAE